MTSEPLSRRRLRAAPLWLCLDLAEHPATALCARAEAVLARVPDAALWLRSPAQTSGGALLALGRSLAALGAPLLVGERVDVALACGAAGVHLGRAAIDPARLTRWRDEGLGVTATAHDEDELRGRLGRCDALVVSPVFPVAGKGPALGLEGLAALVALARGAHVVALGGLDDAERAAAAKVAGARAVAVRSLLRSDDFAPRCEALANALRRGTAAGSSYES